MHENTYVPKRVFQLEYPYPVYQTIQKDPMYFKSTFYGEKKFFQWKSKYKMIGFPTHLSI